MKMNKKGFTLIEMLVVIAIIAILAAIVIPTASTATKKAKEAADVANLRSAVAEAQIATLDGSTASDAWTAAYSKISTKMNYATQYKAPTFTDGKGTVEYTCSATKDASGNAQKFTWDLSDNLLTVN